MLPPSKRFKMENSLPVHQNGVETPRTGKLQHEERVSNTGALVLTWCHHCSPDGSLKIPTTPETSAASASIPTSSSSETSVASGSSTTSPTPVTSGSVAAFSNPQTSSVKHCSVSVSPLTIPDPSKLTTSAESGSRWVGLVSFPDDLFIYKTTFVWLGTTVPVA